VLHNWGIGRSPIIPTFMASFRGGSVPASERWVACRQARLLLARCACSRLLRRRFIEELEGYDGGS